MTDRTARHKVIGAARYDRYRLAAELIECGASVAMACKVAKIDRSSFYHTRRSLNAGAAVTEVPFASGLRTDLLAPIGRRGSQRRFKAQALATLYHRLYQRLWLAQKRGLLLGVPRPSLRQGRLRVDARALPLLRPEERRALFDQPRG